MKKVILILIILFCAASLPAQSTHKEEKTVLFLIPFYEDIYDSQTATNAQSCDDIDQIPSFKMMGFWNGAQLALEELDSLKTPLRIIVKDIANNDTKLRSIMENKTLMNEVDLIIGPFFSKQFLIAAKYAKEYQIPIVNPFTSRTDILNGNEFVYKLLSSKESRPAMVSYFVDHYPSHQILIWKDTTSKTKDYLTFTRYFQQHKIAYKVVKSGPDILKLLKKGTQNIILSLEDDIAKSMMLSQQLYTQADLENLTLIVPESWMQSATYDVDYYSKLNLHFFSDYYIDYDNEATVVFIDKYKNRYKSPPTIDNFAYQGYDITRYFIALLFNDMDMDRVKITPISYPFSFDKVPQGGYENVNIQFLEVKDNEIIPAEW